MAAGGEIDLPILTEESIIFGVQEFAKVQFSSNDLKNPTYEKMYSVYMGFLCNLVKVSSDRVTQIPLHTLQTMTQPQPYFEDAAAKLLFVKSLEYLFNLCFVKDFAMNDLTSPSRKRTRKLLSQLVNFCQYELSQESEIHERIVKLNTIGKDHEKLKIKREKLIERISQLKEKREEDRHKIQEMNLNALQVREENLRGHVEQQDQIIFLKSLDIEEIQNVLTVKRASKLLKQAKETVEERKARGNDLAVKEDMINVISEFAPIALKLEEGISEDLQKYEEVIKRNEKLQDLSVEKSMQLKEVLAEIQNLTRQINRHVEKKQQVTALYQKKMETCKEQKVKFQEREILIRHDIKVKEEILNATREEIKKILEESYFGKQEHQRIMQILKDTFASVIKKLENYEKDFMENCKEITSDMAILETVA